MKTRVKSPDRRAAADEVVETDLRGVMISGHRAAKEVEEAAEVWVVVWVVGSPE